MSTATFPNTTRRRRSSSVVCRQLFCSSGALPVQECEILCAPCGKLGIGGILPTLSALTCGQHAAAANRQRRQARLVQGAPARGAAMRGRHSSARLGHGDLVELHGARPPRALGWRLSVFPADGAEPPRSNCAGCCLLRRNLGPRTHAQGRAPTRAALRRCPAVGSTCCPVAQGIV